MKSVIGIVAAIAFVLPSLALAGNHNTIVAQLQPTNAGADCVFFTLDGAPEADPVKPRDPSFALSRSQFGAKEAYAMLLSAKLAGQTLTVQTSGTLSCDYASVYAITAQ